MKQWAHGWPLHLLMNLPDIHIWACLTQLKAELKALQELDPSATPGTTRKQDELIAEIQEQIS